MSPNIDYDAVLIVSFGGPENPGDVIPFLENVLRGRNVPRERLLAVAEHYNHFGGVSPINAQNRALIAALEPELRRHGLDLPIYWGNRNWHPLLPDTLRQMAQDGIKQALAFVTSAYSSYSGCRQYREDIERARAEVGEGAPHVTLLPKFYNHPGFIRPNVEHVRAALHQIPSEKRDKAHVVFTAHSIPLSMARNCAYEAQLGETCRLIAHDLAVSNYQLAYQSRSGSSHQPWLTPDIGETLQNLKTAGVEDVVIAPVGFISDHMEVLYDLDVEAKQLADAIGLNVVRAATVGTHPEFVSMIRELVQEAMLGGSGRICPEDCCLSGVERPVMTKVEPA